MDTPCVHTPVSACYTVTTAPKNRHVHRLLPWLFCDYPLGAQRRLGRLSLVDLAGSERIKSSEAHVFRGPLKECSAPLKRVGGLTEGRFVQLIFVRTMWLPYKGII